MDRLIVTPELLDEIESLGPGDQALWLFLDQSDEFRGYWEVTSLYNEFLFDFEDIIGDYRLVSPVTVAEFMDRAEELEYKVAFMQDPVSILDPYEALTVVPEVALNSTIEGNQNGFLPWQITGYNKLVKDETIKAGYVVWLTGGGKMFFIASAIRHHMEVGHPFDFALVVVKSHNKIDSQRKLKGLADIDSVLIDGAWSITRQKNGEKYTVPGPRQIALQEIEAKLSRGERVVAVTNYEKLREDTEQFKHLVTGRDCLFFWDEMPTKLSNRQTQLYKSVKSILYKSFYSKPNPKWMRHWALTATPIENSPNDVFSCVHLMNPGQLGTVTEFYNTHVAHFNHFTREPEVWKNLGRLEAKLQHMTHRVSKEDPQVRDMFPNVIPMETYIDWSPSHRKVYDALTGKAMDMVDQLEDANVLSLIQVMQMMCDAPSMILASAQNRERFYAALETYDDLNGLPQGPMGSDVALTLINSLGPKSFANKGHTKLEKWLEIICDAHPDAKVVTHSTWAEYIFPVWEEALTERGISYVVYHGSTKEKQRALDAFRDDPSIRCFLSGDAGADSIDINEASVGINYNIPWKWTTMKQREGRRDRVNSTYDTIYTYTLTMPDSVDERKLAICEQKYAYHQQIFDGKASDEMFSVALTRDDLMYMLFGSVI